MKFSTLEANQTFSIAIFIEKQINRANEAFENKKISIEEIVSYRKSVISEVELLKQKIENIAKNNLDNNSTQKIFRRIT